MGKKRFSVYLASELAAREMTQKTLVARLGLSGGNWNTFRSALSRL